MVLGSVAPSGCANKGFWVMGELIITSLGCTLRQSLNSLGRWQRALFGPQKNIFVLKLIKLFLLSNVRSTLPSQPRTTLKFPTWSLWKIQRAKQEHIILATLTTSCQSRRAWMLSLPQVLPGDTALARIHVLLVSSGAGFPVQKSEGCYKKPLKLRPKSGYKLLLPQWAMFKQTTQRPFDHLEERTYV